MDKRNELQKDFSTENVKYLKKNKRGYNDIAMRMGKTSVALLTIKELKCKKVLVLYPDLKIKDSWLKDIERLKMSLDMFTFSHYMSVKKCTDKYDICIVDEFPEMSTAQLNNVKELINNLNCYVLGLSGTVSEESRILALNELNMKGIVKYSAEQAIKDGIISNYQVTVHSVPLDNTKKYLKNSKGESISEHTKYLNFNYIIESNKRRGINNKFFYIQRNNLVKNSISKNKAILDLMKTLNGRVLTFVGSIKAAEKLKIPVFHSKTKDLQEFEDFKSGKTKQLAVIGIGGSGVTYLQLSHLIIANITWNEEDISQKIFRCMLLDYDDKVADIHILISSEETDLKKCKQALSMLDQNKIKYL
jgi:superfamily II DNA or RNA helicase